MTERQTGAARPPSQPTAASEAASRLQVTVTDHDTYGIVTVCGEVDVTTGSELREPLHDLLRRGLLHHVVDLRDVTFLDSTGLGILVGDHKRLRDRDGSLQVVCGPGLVSRVFRLTGVDRVVPIRSTVEAAVDLLTDPNMA